MITMDTKKKRILIYLNSTKLTCWIQNQKKIFIPRFDFFKIIFVKKWIQVQIMTKNINVENLKLKRFVSKREIRLFVFI